jgi:predicted Zn-dependent peptidase
MRVPVLTALVLFSAARAFAAGVPPGCAEETLPNGVRVVLIQHRANPMVASAVVVRAGVVHEPASASGASHFLEHLLFNGTTSRSQKQLYDDVDRIGAYNNATTREDHTLFTLLVAKPYAEQGLAIQADMLFHSTIPADSFDKERKIVLEELARDRTDPGYDVNEAFRAFGFADTPIARPVLGTEASLQAITREQVVAYYKARYVPSNMTVVVMGDFDIPAMRAAVKKAFGAAAAGARAREGPGAVWPPPPKDNLLLEPAPAGPSRLIAAFPWTADPWEKSTTAAALLIAAATRGTDAPLARALQRRGISPEGVRVELELRARPWSTVSLDAEVAEGLDPTAVLDALAESVRATAPGGAARGRVDRVRIAERAEAAMARDQIHYFAMMRSASIAGSPTGYLLSDSVRFDAIGPDDLNAASERLIASLAAVRARFTGTGATSSRASWKPPVKTGGPNPAALVAGTLDNGARYVVRATDDSDVFAMHVAFAPRSASEPTGQDGITDLLHRMMLRGTANRSEAGIEDALARAGAKIKTVDDPSVPFDDYYTTPEFSWLRLEAPGETWREALEIAAETITAPSLEAASLDISRREMLDLIARGEGSPRGAALAKLDGLLAPGSPVTRPVLGTRDTLAGITPERLAAFRASTIVGRRLIVTVVSRVPTDQVVEALVAAFGTLPPGEPVPPAPSRRMDAAETAELVLGKSQAYLALGKAFDLDPKDRAALTVAVAMLSDRLAFDLRETRGMAYTIGASLRAWDGRTRCDVTMGTRLENVDAALDGLRQGMTAFRASDISADDVARAVNKVRGTALMRRMTRISLAYEAGVEALRGREPGEERRAIDGLAAVTPADVKRVAGAYLDPGSFSTSVVR